MAVQHVAWDNQALLAQNKERLLKDLRRRLRAFEGRFELSSERVEEELASGRLRETAEVCDWVIALRTYRALVNAG